MINELIVLLVRKLRRKKTTYSQQGDVYVHDSDGSVLRLSPTGEVTRIDAYGGVRVSSLNDLPRARVNAEANASQAINRYSAEMAANAAPRLGFSAASSPRTAFDSYPVKKKTIWQEKEEAKISENSA